MELFGYTVAEAGVFIGILGSVLGVCRKYRITPRSFFVWLAMVRAAETARADATYWKIEAETWRKKAEDCQHSSRASPAVSNGGS